LSVISGRSGQHGFGGHTGCGLQEGFASGALVGLGAHELPAISPEWPKTEAAANSEATIHDLVFRILFSMFALRFE